MLFDLPIIYFLVQEHRLYLSVSTSTCSFSWPTLNGSTDFKWKMFNEEDGIGWRLIGWLPSHLSSSYRLCSWWYQQQYIPVLIHPSGNTEPCCQLRTNRSQLNFKLQAQHSELTRTPRETWGKKIAQMISRHMFKSNHHLISSTLLHPTLLKNPLWSGHCIPYLALIVPASATFLNFFATILSNLHTSRSF